ncbi:hypothetical protein AMTRI_Chr09g16600 [Amborella trichopoda]
MATYWSGPFLLLGLLILQTPSCAVQVVAMTPAVFFFGDSIFDVGNNNYLDTIAKANIPPYGIDFPGGTPTGRFTNGLNIADFLSMQVGWKRSPPAFLSLARRDFPMRIFSGVNFASGGAGILNETGIIFISQFTTIYNNFAIRVGENLAQVIQKDEMVATITSIYKAHLQFGIMGMSNTGCIPSQRWQNDTGGCIEEPNDVARRFNVVMTNVMQDLSSELGEMTYSCFDGIHLPPVGFAEMDTACCGSGKLNGERPCSPKTDLFVKRTDYYYWDAYHPTQTLAKGVADSMCNGSPPSVAPINFNQLWRS